MEENLCFLEEFGGDALPEDCKYQDEGCEFARSCLNCPFPVCIYEEPRGKQRWLKKQRDKEILRLLRKGKNQNELSLMFSVSKRTIQRAVKKYTSKKAICELED